jgi:predicted Rossmann-fold nucleotide-binding protein
VSPFPRTSATALSVIVTTAALVLIGACSSAGINESASTPGAPISPSGDIEIESISEFRQLNGQLSGHVIQGVDLQTIPLRDIEQSTVKGTVFLGAQLTPAQARALRQQGAMVVDPLPQFSFNAYRSALYSQAELDARAAQGEVTLDERIYKEYEDGGRFPQHAMESHARSLHDDSIEDALREYIVDACPAASCKGMVGIMGGASEPRGTIAYRETARIAWELARAGYFVVTAGGTGMMEAGNLGARMAQLTEQELKEAIDLLATKPKYNPEPSDGYSAEDYKDVARTVRDSTAAKQTRNLGIPTWFYGHEPTNAFATEVAKYFSNGIREDRVLEISSRGLVIVKGSAGTRQEIFMEAAQEHYGTYGQCSAIIFVGDQFVRELDVVRQAAEKAANHPDPAKRTYYVDVLKSAKTAQEVVKALDDTPPMEANNGLCERPAPKTVPATVTGLNSTFRSSYDSAIERHAARMRASYPIVTQDLLNMTLLRPGATPEPFSMKKRTYFLMAHTTHPPLTIYSILAKYGFGDLNDAAVAELTAYRDQLTGAINNAKSLGDIDADIRLRLFPILEASQKYLEQCITRRNATRQSFESYARPLSETIRGNFRMAAQEQLIQFKEKMEAWKTAYPNEKWSALRVVVMGGHQARDMYALKLFFQWLLREPGYEKHVVYAEDQSMPVGLNLPASEVAGLQLLTKVDFDNDVGQIIFGDPSIMQRDVMGPAAQSILKEWGPSQWPPVPSN